MIPRRSRAALRMCWTSASFVADPPGRIARSSANPTMAFNGARSFWLRVAGKARSSGESASDTLGSGGGSFITLMSLRLDSSLRSRRGPNFRFSFRFHPQTRGFVEGHVPQLFHHLDVPPHFVLMG